MANTDRPRGFKPYGRDPLIGLYKADGSQTIAVGDLVVMDSDGYIDIATAGSGNAIVGVAASAVASATEGDAIYVWCDPNQMFIGQCSDALDQNDLYAAASTGTAIDFTGSTGIMELVSQDVTTGCLKIMQLMSDPGTGAASAIGSNATVLFRIDPQNHLYGAEA